MAHYSTTNLSNSTKDSEWLGLLCACLMHAYFTHEEYAELVQEFMFMDAKAPKEEMEAYSETILMHVASN